jgi:bacillithiol biosynthesis deacetylase BshB1
MKLDIIAIGVHPDDVELGCSGTIMRHIQLGCKVGIVDLTRGELGTRGTAEIRDKEAQDAAKIIGVSIRDNLGFRDGFFKNDEEHQLKLIQIIRKYQPDIVITNAPTDRHPDHGRASQLTLDAAFLSGLPKIVTKLNGKNQISWQPKAVYHYIQAQYHEPDFVIDISKFHERKLEAILAYKTQFYNPDSKEPETFISNPQFLESVKARDIMFGIHAGFKYAEGFLKNRYLGIEDLRHLK